MRKWSVRTGVTLALLVQAAGSMSAVASTAAAQQVRVAEDATAARTRVSTRDILTRPVTVELQRVSLRTAVNEIARSANVRIQYRADLLDAVTKPVSLHANAMPLGAALETVLAGSGMRPEPLTENIITVKPVYVAVTLEQGIIVGKIINGSTKQPIRGATILLGEADRGVQSNDDGTYRASAPEGEVRVTVRAVGYTKQSRLVTVRANESVTADFTLEQRSSVLDEVVVTGTVVATERKALPTPITVVTADEIQRRGITRIDQLFRGAIPGVFAAEQGSTMYYGGTNSTTTVTLGAMQTSKVYVRGSSAASPSASETPLKTYVDGVEILNSSYLGTIDPASIERIEVITGPQAATLYGSGAMGGVMQIFTKKGGGRASSDLVLSLKFGMLENNFSDALTPSHQHNLTFTGGTGPDLSYSANASYLYTGQWRPALFNQSYGLSVGVNHVRGPVTVNGSVSTTNGRNGSLDTRNGGSPIWVTSVANGEWSGTNLATYLPKRQGTSSSETSSLNVDYRVNSSWQHHLTIGRAKTDFGVAAEAPTFGTPTDTLMFAASSNGARMTFSYNTTLLGRVGPMSSTLTVGGNGTNANQSQSAGCRPSGAASSWVGCSSTAPIAVRQLLRENSWGAFGSMQMGFADQLFLTLGLRAEQNPNYGREHKIDWTPTNGITYTVEHGDLTVKFLGAYGRATRAPSSDQKLAQYVDLGPENNPTSLINRFANPALKPEYSHGPEGGIELYYGNLGSLTVNRYIQTVSDLIQNVVVDTAYYTYLTTNTDYIWPQTKFMNVAKVRQHGWESTGSLTLGMLQLQGTYSWNDSRILEAQTAQGISYYKGQSFLYIPTHTGNVTVNFAHAGTSVTVVTNWVGRSSEYIGNTFLAQNNSQRRLKADQDRALGFNIPVGNMLIDKPAYTKVDITAMRQLTPWASFTVNVLNAGNVYAMDGGSAGLNAALGRQTLLGVSLRYP